MADTSTGFECFTFRGKAIEELSREELLEALRVVIRDAANVRQRAIDNMAPLSEMHIAGRSH